MIISEYSMEEMHPDKSSDGGLPLAEILQGIRPPLGCPKWIFKLFIYFLALINFFLMKTKHIL